MCKSLKLWAVVCLSIQLGAGAAHAAQEPAINCKSSTGAPKNVDFKTYAAFCDAEAAAERTRSGARLSAAVAAAGSVQQNLKTPDEVDFSNVPVWSDADIVAQFAATRDARYLTSTGTGCSQAGPACDPTFPRRISWLMPQNGCEARAEQFKARVVQAGKTAPYKLFAMSLGERLRPNTANDPDGYVEWDWHVVPVVKNPAGQVIVFDAALNPCRPLSYKAWLRLMSPDLSEYSDPANGHGVGLGDSNAYRPSSLVTGEPSHGQESYSALTGINLDPAAISYLDAEWNLQYFLLDRDPAVVLGTTPTWSGFNCVSVDSESTWVNVAPNSTATVNVTCPYATKVVGGGGEVHSGDPLIAKSAKNGNGWQIVARSATGSGVGAFAGCLTGAPTNASVTTVTGTTVNISPGSFNTSNASCASGTLVGGGFSTTSGSSIMRVYNNRRSSASGSTWQTAAQNTTGSTKSLTGYAYCLSGTSFTFSQVSGAPVPSDPPACASTREVMGGGFTFPRTSALAVRSMSYYFGNVFRVELLPWPSPDASIAAYAQCLAHP